MTVCRLFFFLHFSFWQRHILEGECTIFFHIFFSRKVSHPVLRGTAESVNFVSPSKSGHLYFWVRAFSFSAQQAVPWKHVLMEDHWVVTGVLGEGAGSKHLSQEGKLDVCCSRNENLCARTLLQREEAEDAKPRWGYVTGSGGIWCHPARRCGCTHLPTLSHQDTGRTTCLHHWGLGRAAARQPSSPLEKEKHQGSVHHLRNQKSREAGLERAMEETEGGFCLHRRGEVAREPEGGIRE